MMYKSSATLLESEQSHLTHRTDHVNSVGTYCISEEVV